MEWTRRGPFFVHSLLSFCRSCERGRVAFVGLQQLAIWIVVRRRKNALCKPTRVFHLRESAGRFLDAPGQPREERFLYSPPLLLGVMGIRQVWRRKPELVTAIGASSLILVLFLSCISFAGGDWCWGPRYLTPLLPLWALVFPFAVGVNVRRDLAVAVVGVGLLVQVLALGVENQRFFFERGLNDFFWAEDSWVYFKRSALFARVGEAASLSEGMPPTAQFFNSIPITDWSTYTVLGPPPSVSRRLAPQWIRNFKIYFVPRPWPLWMSWLPPSRRPVDMRAWLLSLLSVAIAGAGLIYRGLREGECA